MAKLKKSRKKKGHLGTLSGSALRKLKSQTTGASPPKQPLKTAIGKPHG